MIDVCAFAGVCVCVFVCAHASCRADAGLVNWREINLPSRRLPQPTTVFRHRFRPVPGCHHLCHPGGDTAPSTRPPGTSRWPPGTSTRLLLTSNRCTRTLWPVTDSG